MPEQFTMNGDDDRRDAGGGNGGGGNDSTTPNTGAMVKARPKSRKPAMYKVLMLNDDYTPMEFVVHVLERFFQKTRERIDAHHAQCPSQGRGRVWRVHL